MLETFYYDLPLWFIILTLLGLLLVATEVGFRRGHRDRDRFGDPAKTQVGTVEAALLGLLGLLLGFTYSMASSRYDTRKGLVAAEVNAIRAVVLRTRLLPPEVGDPARDRLNRYIAARIDAARSADARRDEANAETRQIQTELWDIVAREAAAPKRPEMTGLFIQALTEMADSKTRRDAALADHVPISVLSLVFVANILVFGTVGYGFGLTGSRGVLATTLLAVLVAMVVMVVLDLDRPRTGLIRVGHQALVRLHENLGLDRTPLP